MRYSLAGDPDNSADRRVRLAGLVGGHDRLFELEPRLAQPFLGTAPRRDSTRWLQGQMGRATLAMTADRYGHFGEPARKREAAKLEGAFRF